MHGVEAVAAADEVGGRLRRAADTGEFDEVLGLEGDLPGGLDNGSSDGVVAAAGAQGGQGALVVAAGEAERVLRAATGWRIFGLAMKVIGLRARLRVMRDSARALG